MTKPNITVHKAEFPLVSVVIPVFNEEGNIRALYNELRRVTDELFYRFEWIFVDDGSSDHTVEIIAQLHEEDASVKLVRFARNFGHQAAITAGMEYAAGDAVITMDADLQHPPALIPELLRQWKLGFEVVLTQRVESKQAGLFKKVTSGGFYWLMNRCMDRPILPGGADFRLMDRKVVDQLNSLQERSRFMRGLISWVGFRQIAIPYVAEPRFAGVSKYTVRKMLRFATDGLTSFSIFPLRIATYLGLLAALSGLPYALWAVWTRLFTDTAAPGWASLIVSILFLGGVQLICLGVLGEYVGRIYEEVKCRPLYIARDTMGLDTHRVSDHHERARINVPRNSRRADEDGEDLIGAYADEASA
ncbi:MAG: glycosyltransferase family 2 protein [Planctomycetaceae bacterium]|nr:glycosyltransferase family 2 protein [Planctomycetaceae bacterium]